MSERPTPGVLLVAGPSAIEEPDTQRHSASRPWHGAGFYAAAAAAACTATQLWSRVPADVRAEEWAPLERRGIDCAGCSAEGSGALPDLEPVSADDLGAVLICGLHGEELARARRVVAALPGHGDRVEVVALADEADTEDLAHAAGAAVLIAGVRPGTDPSTTIDHLLAGHQAVLLTAGALGGIAGYKAKRWTWPAQPTTGDTNAQRARAVFAGVLAAQAARVRRIDWRLLKRAAVEAGAVAGTAIRRPGPKGLMHLDAAAYHQAFVALRRNHKF